MAVAPDPCMDLPGASFAYGWGGNGKGKFWPSTMKLLFQGVRRYKREEMDVGKNEGFRDTFQRREIVRVLGQV